MIIESKGKIINNNNNNNNNGNEQWNVIAANHDKDENDKDTDIKFRVTFYNKTLLIAAQIKQ